MHSAVAAQAWSQPPQCAVEDRVSTQAPPHAMVGASHAATHDPAEHT